MSENDKASPQRNQATPDTQKSGFLSLILRHKVATLCGSFGAFIVFAFTQNLINVQIACSINFAQPTISDACGYFGLGDKPTRDERVAWTALYEQLKSPSEENCARLANHARRFSNGAFAAEADRLARNPITTEIVTWTPQTRTLPNYEPIPETGLQSEAEAKIEARSRAKIRANAQCAGYANNGPWRVAGFKVTDEKLTCDVSGGTHFCELSATTQCALEQRSVKTVAQCGFTD